MLILFVPENTHGLFLNLCFRTAYIFLPRLPFFLNLWRVFRHFLGCSDVLSINMANYSMFYWILV